MRSLLVRRLVALLFGVVVVGGLATTQTTAGTQLTRVGPTSAHQYAATAHVYDTAAHHSSTTTAEPDTVVTAISASAGVRAAISSDHVRSAPVFVAAETAGTSWADAGALDRTVNVGGKSVSILGDVSRSGSTATVDNIALYGTNGELVNQVGGQALRDAGGSLLREASGSGVNQVIFRGVRAVNSSGKAGHVVNWIATLGDDGSVNWTLGR